MIRRRQDVLPIVRAAAKLLSDRACAVLAQWVQQQTDTVRAYGFDHYRPRICKWTAHSGSLSQTHIRRKAVENALSRGQRLFYRRNERASWVGARVNGGCFIIHLSTSLLLFCCPNITQNCMRHRKKKAKERSVGVQGWSGASAAASGKCVCGVESGKEAASLSRWFITTKALYTACSPMSHAPIKSESREICPFVEFVLFLPDAAFSALLSRWDLIPFQLVDAYQFPLPR